MTDLVEAKPTLKGSYYKITYLWIWLRQEVFWYCKMVQFILVWVSKPTLIKNIRLRWTTGDGKRKNINVTQGRNLTYLQRVPGFSAGEWSQPGQPGHQGPQVSLYGFVCWWNLQLYREIFQVNLMLWKQQMGRNKKYVLHVGRGFIALGLIKILGINGVLLLSTFSLNFSWGLATFLAWSSRNISERLPEPEPW